MISVTQMDLCVVFFRGWRFRELSKEQGEKGAHHIHRGAAAGAASQLPARLQSRRPGSGEDSANHWSQQKGYASLVSKLQSAAEEAPAHRQNQV
jgi:hypothetical protein